MVPGLCGVASVQEEGLEHGPEYVGHFLNLSCSCYLALHFPGARLCGWASASRGEDLASDLLSRLTSAVPIIWHQAHSLGPLSTQFLFSCIDLSVEYRFLPRWTGTLPSFSRVLLVVGWHFSCCGIFWFLANAVLQSLDGHWYLL